IEEIAYPPHLSMEQCSSEQTAQYKAQLLARFVSTFSKQVHFIDLTGGLGVDFSFIAQAIGTCKAVYVERDAHLCELARHNFPLLGLPNAEIVCDTAENYLHQRSTVTHPPSTILFLDPARRDAHGNRTYALADCTPNVLEIRDELLKIADFIVLKLSPMLDWHRAIEELGNVSEVHIVSVANECKEMLLVMKKNPENLKIFCVNDQQLFSYEETGTMAQKHAVPCISNVASLVGKSHLFVPNASVMKAGCFAELCEQFHLEALAPNSHLFVRVGDDKQEDFPGRKFQISAISSMNKREIREKLSGIAQANIAVRNFPMKPEELRRRLKMREGGDTYIFATTLAGKKHVLIVCKHV
ncbi:MAG: SAM-dependent methyltransferase, partial [Prevotella sp.]|nr:SAM-dependent methyltransferase [Prevotella sp.]